MNAYVFVYHIYEVDCINGSKFVSLPITSQKRMQCNFSIFHQEMEYIFPLSAYEFGQWDVT
jgi:hypothetical protein